LVFLLAPEVEVASSKQGLIKVWDKNGYVVVEITERHIERALRKNSSHCAVAMGVKASVPDAKRIAVDLQTIRFTRRSNGIDLRYCFLTPRAAQDCIVHTDQGERELIQPFAMHMRPAFVVKCGKSKSHTPSNRELRGSGLTVNKTQLHLQKPVEEQPKTESITTTARNLDPDRSDGLAASATYLHQALPKRGRPKGSHSRNKAMVSTAKKGNVPTTLGGKLPPIGVLNRREFGLRALRK
jgi:hypothetical protein